MHPTHPRPETDPRRVCHGEDHGYCCPEGIYLPQPDGTAVHRDDLTTPRPVETTPADILRGAAGYLHRHGWTQDSYYFITGEALPPACAVGAIAMAAYGQPADHPFSDPRPQRRTFARAVDFLNSHLHTEYGDDDGDNAVYQWNDWPDRTAAEVIATLYAAADDWDHTHQPGGAR